MKGEFMKEGGLGERISLGMDVKGLEGCGVVKKGVV